MTTSRRIKAHRRESALRSGALMLLLILLAGASAWVFAGPWGALWGGLSAAALVPLTAQNTCRAIPSSWRWPSPRPRLSATLASART